MVVLITVCKSKNALWLFDYLVLIIQCRGAFDISLIASIASHLTYWADEDVNHFILSQILSRRSFY